MAGLVLSLRLSFAVENDIVCQYPLRNKIKNKKIKRLAFAVGARG